MNLSKIRNILTSTVSYQKLGFKIIRFEADEVILHVPITPDTTNPIGGLHGGIIALLVDEAGTAVICLNDRELRPGLTTDLSVSCVRPCYQGMVHVHAKSIKAGQNMGFAQVDIFDEKGQCLAQGRLSKFLYRTPSANNA